MKNRKLLSASLLCSLLAAWALPAAAEDQPQTLFTNINIFDGSSDTLATNKRVLVEGNLIKTIGDETLKANSDATVVDGGGRTLMPGLIEAHAHLMLMGPSLPAMESNTTWETLRSMVLKCPRCI